MQQWYLEHCGKRMRRLYGADVLQCEVCGGVIPTVNVFRKWGGLLRACRAD